MSLDELTLIARYTELLRRLAVHMGIVFYYYIWATLILSWYLLLQAFSFSKLSCQEPEVWLTVIVPVFVGMYLSRIVSKMLPKHGLKAPKGMTFYAFMMFLPMMLLYSLVLPITTIYAEKIGIPEYLISTMWSTGWYFGLIAYMLFYDHFIERRLHAKGYVSIRSSRLTALLLILLTPLIFFTSTLLDTSATLTIGNNVFKFDHTLPLIASILCLVSASLVYLLVSLIVLMKGFELVRGKAG